MKFKNEKLKILCECAMLVSLATVLSFIKVYEAPLGGSVTLFSMIPILLCGFLFGARAGFASAFVYSCLQLLFGIGTVAYVPDPLGIVLCTLLDYIFAFTLLGVTGFFKHMKINIYLKVTLGTLFALLLRFACHILSGGIVWYAITKDGAWNEAVFRHTKWIYSLIYNSQFMIPEIILSLVAIPTAVALIRLVQRKRN